MSCPCGHFITKRQTKIIKTCQQIKTLTTGQHEDYTTRCLFDYDNINNYQRLTAVDLSKQKELNASPKIIQQIEFVG